MTRRPLLPVPCSLFPRVSWLLAFGLLSSLPGCAKEEWDRFFDSFRKDSPRSRESMPPSHKNSIRALQGAIGPMITLEGAQLLQVRGYGLVVDLVDSGGADGPQQVKEYLTKQVRKNQEIGVQGITTEQLFKGKDACMVEVTGLIPAAAKKGDYFDVVVKALGSSTKSLVGGRLVLCDLKMYAETPQGVIEGKTLATASGPVFVTIFEMSGEPSAKVDLRTGFILGGAVVKEPRRVRLILNEPRYAVAQQMVARINGRYAGIDPIADGKSAGAIDITIPDEYRNRKRLFLEQLAHTTLNDNPALLEKRSAELAQDIELPDADGDSIGLAFQAIGKIALPQIKTLYQHALPEVRYFAARTGTRMQDNAGMEELCKFALEPENRFRMQAIDELGFAVNMYGAGEALKKLLDDSDEEVRIKAYRALRRRRHPVINTSILDKDNLVLDVIDSNGPYLIYVQRLEQPRIAIFGKAMRCHDNAIFPGARRDDRRLLTQITANPGDPDLTILYKNKHTGLQSEPLHAPYEVAALIEFLGDTPTKNDKGQFQKGLAVPFSEIVDILQTLCKAGSIPAKFKVEDLKESEEAPVEETKERTESEY